MATAILCACVSCGAQFEFKKQKSNKYCSMDCYRAAQRRGDYARGHGPTIPVGPCEHCGRRVQKLFTRRRDGTLSDKLFCDRSCYDAYRSAIIAARATPCRTCGKEFDGKGGARKYCSERCRNLQRKADPTHCLGCGSWFTPVRIRPCGSLVSINKLKTCSPECQRAWYRNDEERKRKIGEAFTGAKHPMWKGGVTHQQLGYRGTNWQTQRAKALKRDRYCCVDCGMTDAESLEKYGEGLSVDHVVPYHNFGNYKKANKLSNLESRCKACHRMAESKRTMCQMVLPLNGKRHHQHRGYKAGSAHPKAKITEADVVSIRRRADQGEAPTEIGRSYGLGCSHVSAIIDGKVWRNVPLGESAGVARKPAIVVPRGEANHLSRLTAEQVMEMRRRADAGERLQRIADDMGETYASVYQIVRGKTWKHLPVLGYTTNRAGKMPTCSS